MSTQPLCAGNAIFLLGQQQTAGWSLQFLKALFLADHTVPNRKNKITQTMDLARQILGLPDEYLIGIVPGSDTVLLRSRYGHCLVRAVMYWHGIFWQRVGQ